MDGATENLTSLKPSSNGSMNLNNKNILIGVLIFLLVLSFLGINLLAMFGGLYQSIVNIFGPIVYKFLALIGITTGTVLNKTADVVADTAKLGVDLSEGAVQDVGNLLINAGKNGADLDLAINKPFLSLNPLVPEADKPENPIQKPVSAGKTKWCLVGEYQGRRGCIEITDQDKCLSGQVFPEQKMCLNPTFTPNMPPPTVHT